MKCVYGQFSQIWLSSIIVLWTHELTGLDVLCGNKPNRVQFKDNLMNE